MTVYTQSLKIPIKVIGVEKLKALINGVLISLDYSQSESGEYFQKFLFKESAVFNHSININLNSYENFVEIIGFFSNSSYDENIRENKLFQISIHLNNEFQKYLHNLDSDKQSLENEEPISESLSAGNLEESRKVKKNLTDVDKGNSPEKNLIIFAVVVAVIFAIIISSKNDSSQPNGYSSTSTKQINLEGKKFYYTENGAGATIDFSGGGGCFIFGMAGNLKLSSLGTYSQDGNTINFKWDKVGPNNATIENENGNIVIVVNGPEGTIKYYQ